jgi:tellurite resistance protein TerC
VKRVRKLVIAVIGTTVLLVGIAMILLPGPAFVLIPAGLAILATEFAWAKALLRKAAEKFKKKNQT